MQAMRQAWLRRAGRWIVTWPHGRRSAVILALLFWTSGQVANRIDGLAVMDLPYGPVIADGVLTIPAGEVIALGPPPPLPVTRPGDVSADPIEEPAEEPAKEAADEAAGDPIQVAPPLTIATEGDYPPFNFVDATGALRGLEVDLVYAVCAELKVTCEIVSRRWDRLLPGLADSEYQVVAASLRIPKQPPQGIAFSRPYFGNAAAFATREGDVAARITGPIGVETGTRMAAYLAAQNDRVPVRSYPDAVSTYQALLDDEVSAVFDDAVRLNRWLNDPSATCCVMAGQPVFSTAYFGPGVGFALRDDDDDLLDRLNQALDQLAQEGRIAELSDRYLPFALN